MVNYPPELESPIYFAESYLHFFYLHLISTLKSNIFCELNSFLFTVYFWLLKFGAILIYLFICFLFIPSGLNLDQNLFIFN